jgi:ribonuclease PH
LQTGVNKLDNKLHAIIFFKNKGIDMIAQKQLEKILQKVLHSIVATTLLEQNNIQIDTDLVESKQEFLTIDETYSALVLPIPKSKQLEQENLFFDVSVLSGGSLQEYFIIDFHPINKTVTVLPQNKVIH